MTTSTMDLSHAPTRAGRRTPTPSKSYRALRLHDVAVAVGMTDRGRPPPTYYSRFVAQAMWALTASALLHAFGADIAAWMLRMVSG